MLTYVKLIFTACFWGGTFIAGRQIAPSVDPNCAAFLRFVFASFFLVLFTLKREGRLPGLSWGQTIIVCLLGLTGILSYNLFFFSGLKHIQANQASLIIATNPIVISLCAALFFSEPLNLKKIAGLLISVTGAMIVISDGQLDRLLGLGAGRGELLIFGCVISWVAYSIIGKKAMTNLSPLVSVCYSAVAGTLFLLIPALSNGLVDQLPAYGMVEWGSLFYLGFFGTTLGFFWYYEGIKEIGPMRAGMFINFVPVSAIILSFFILGEPLTLSLVIGGGFVISGVLLTNMGNLIK